MSAPISVRSRDGWCATKRRTSLQYADSVPTLCGMYVTLPWGLERRQPDCEECREALKRSGREFIEHNQEESQ